MSEEKSPTNKCIYCIYFDGLDEWNGYTLYMCKRWKRKIFCSKDCKWFRRHKFVTDDQLY